MRTPIFTMAEVLGEESPLALAPSELAQHCQFIDRSNEGAEGEEGEDEDPWVFAAAEESVES